jgi:hypothetical protein
MRYLQNWKKFELKHSALLKIEHKAKLAKESGDANLEVGMNHAEKMDAT